MSDYISKSAVIELIESKMTDGCLGTEDDTFIGGHGLVDDISELPTLDETEIIRKAFERVLQRLKDIKDDCFSEYYENLDGEYLHRGRLLGEVIEILRGECGINN